MIWREAVELPFAREERGQASSMMLAVVAAVLVGAVVLFAFGNALGAKGRDQRAADLAAISAAQGRIGRGVLRWPRSSRTRRSPV